MWYNLSFRYLVLSQWISNSQIQSIQFKVLINDSVFVRLVSTTPWENSVGLRLKQITIKLNVFTCSQLRIHTTSYFLWICNLTNLTIVKMVWVCTTPVQPNVAFETEIFSLSNYMEGSVIFPFICSHAIEARSRPFNRINKRWNCIVPHHKCEKIRNDIALKLIWQQSTCHQFKCTWRTNKQTSHVSTESTKRMKERITCGAVQRKGSNGRKRERELLRSCKNVSPLYTSPSLSMFSKCSSFFL